MTQANAADFVLAGEALLPGMLWAGTGSIEVFAVVSLIMILAAVLTLASGEPLAAPAESAAKPDDQT